MLIKSWLSRPWIGLLLVGILLGIAIFGPFFAPYDPLAGSLTDRLQPIGSAGHLLGTDGAGRDILSRLLWGSRPSLLAGLLPVAISTVAGTALGIFAATAPPFVNGFVMRCLDVLMAFPAVLLAIAISAALGPGLPNAILALSVVLIPPATRLVESIVVRLMSVDFMEAARASGASTLSIAFRQLLPNLMPAVLAYCATQVGLCITYAAGLSFIGLGQEPPAPEWGQMLNDLRQNIFVAPALTLVPAAAIFLSAIAFNVLGETLRKRSDVKEAVAV